MTRIKLIESEKDILRAMSSAAQLREEYIQHKQSKGCDLCGRKSLLAFYHRDPKTKEFNIQIIGLRVPQDILEAEIAKCVVICVSCRMRVLGNRLPTARITNKELFYELRRVYEAAKPPELRKRSKRGK